MQNEQEMFINELYHQALTDYAIVYELKLFNNKTDITNIEAFLKGKIITLSDILGVQYTNILLDIEKTIESKYERSMTLSKEGETWE